MTLLYFDGFDNCMSAANAPLMPKPQMIFGGDSTNSQPGRDGSVNGAIKIGGTSGQPLVRYTPDAPIPTLFMGFGWKSNSATTTSLQFYTGGNTTNQCGLFVSATGRWEFWTGNHSTLVASSAPGTTYINATWVHLQIKLVLHTTAGLFQLRVNGVEVINYTGPTAVTSGTITGMRWDTGAGGGGQNAFFDDLWVCDDVNAAATQGRPYNDFLGDLKVVTIVPTGAGDQTQWTPSVGVNWDALDENPPDLAAYVFTSSANSGFRDLYACTDLPAEAISVLALQAKSYAQSTDVGVARYKPIVKEHGVVSSLGNHAAGLTVLPFTGPMTTLRPSDGALISVADVNAMQIGVEAV